MSEQATQPTSHEVFSYNEEDGGKMWADLLIQAPYLAELPSKATFYMEKLLEEEQDPEEIEELKDAILSIDTACKSGLGLMHMAMGDYLGAYVTDFGEATAHAARFIMDEIVEAYEDTGAQAQCGQMELIADFTVLCAYYQISTSRSFPAERMDEMTGLIHDLNPAEPWGIAEKMLVKMRRCVKDPTELTRAAKARLDRLNFELMTINPHTRLH